MLAAGEGAAASAASRSNRWISLRASALLGIEKKALLMG